MTKNVYAKIDPALKERWVTALRSGEYKQGQRALQTCEGENCCLGVLARIEGIPFTDYSKDDIPYRNVSFDFGPDYAGYRVAEGFPPTVWNGLDWAMQAKVAQMNDDGSSFNEIADFIQENF